MLSPLAISRALADPTRLRIMALLSKMELAIGELAQVLGQSQPRVSRHVRILCDAGLAERRREGSWVFLLPGSHERLPAFLSALDQLGGAAPDPWQVADEARLAAVRADRAAAAQSYFAAHAEEWDAMRSLHVAETEVEAAIVDMLGRKRHAVLLDIGTGTGRMIELLAANADRLIGIDRSPEMLRLARAKLSDLDEQRWELRQADVGAIPLEDMSVDVTIFHQMLHYLPSPELAVAEAARLMRSNGQLLIVDFAPHEREELRTSDAHTRLGFSDEQISSWFAASGLKLAQVRDLAGGTLTVKLWLGVKQSERTLKAVSA